MSLYTKLFPGSGERRLLRRLDAELHEKPGFTETFDDFCARLPLSRTEKVARSTWRLTLIGLGTVALVAAAAVTLPQTDQSEELMADGQPPPELSAAARRAVMGSADTLLALGICAQQLTEQAKLDSQQGPGFAHRHQEDLIGVQTAEGAHLPCPTNVSALTHVNAQLPGRHGPEWVPVWRPQITDYFTVRCQDGTTEVVWLPPGSGSTGGDVGPSC